MKPKDAVSTLLSAMTKTSDSSTQQELAWSFFSVLMDAPQAAQHQRSMAAAAWISSGMNQPLASLALLPAAAEPLPCRFSTQFLVEVLKMPMCVGETRRVVLDHLGNRYQRRFADHWDFVRFVKEEKLDLDLTSPPMRPELLTADGKP
jgi:hypothetical protein